VGSSCSNYREIWSMRVFVVGVVRSVARGEESMPGSCYPCYPAAKARHSYGGVRRRTSTSLYLNF
jgi:hypothetical protein